MSYAHSHEAVTTYTALLESDESSTSTELLSYKEAVTSPNGAK
jgi:hypothetical protein